MWPRSDLMDLLEIEHPILQAPMGGESTPAMAIAVCNAGGLGGLGCSFMSGEELIGNINTIRAGTNRSFNLNFFAHSEPQINAEINTQTQAKVAPFYQQLGLDTVPTQGYAPCDTFNESKLKILLDHPPKVVSFHFGIPSLDQVKALQGVGSVILCTATTVAEARWLVDAGVDAVIAQGYEAGGHRGTFDVFFEDYGVGSMALIPQIVDAVDIPVIAAGGIADGRGIAAALVLGASGVQMGSAFLSCPEANVSDDYRKKLKMARDDDTRLTRAFSGRPARARNNRYIEAMAEERMQLPDFPTMYGFSGPLQQADSEHAGNDFDFTLYGQATALNRQLPAAELVERLVEETQSIFKSAVDVSKSR